LVVAVKTLSRAVVEPKQLRGEMLAVQKRRKKSRPQLKQKLLQTRRLPLRPKLRQMHKLQ
jgi:hypothetical protein